ncbi:hypothetical protein A1D31_28880 [Bradyrhizobium liaoningense]|nr:hypothetical protein A1D31_28880 [Bradyrhizobium liaoningense]
MSCCRVQGSRRPSRLYDPVQLAQRSRPREARNRLRQYQRRASACAGLRIICAINKSSKAIRIVLRRISWSMIRKAELRRSERIMLQ